MGRRTRVYTQPPASACLGPRWGSQCPSWTWASTPPPLPLAPHSGGNPPSSSQSREGPGRWVRCAEERAARGSEDRLGDQVPQSPRPCSGPASGGWRELRGRRRPARGARAQRPLACRAGLGTPAWGVGVPALVGWLCPGQSEGVASTCSTFAPTGRPGFVAGPGFAEGHEVRWAWPGPEGQLRVTPWTWGEGGLLAARPQSHGAQGWEGVQGCRARGRGPRPVRLDPHLRGWAHRPPLSTPSPGQAGPSASQTQLPRRRGVSH